MIGDKLTITGGTLSNMSEAVKSISVAGPSFSVSAGSISSLAGNGLSKAISVAGGGLVSAAGSLSTGGLSSSISVAGNALSRASDILGGSVTTIAGGIGGMATQGLQGAANKLINKAGGRLVSVARGAIDNLTSQIPGQLWSLFAQTEDFNQLRHINSTLVHTDFQGEWNFRLDLDDAPDDFDFYLKDLSYSLVDIGTEEQQIGGITFVFPACKQPITFTCTMRDNIDGRINAYFRDWADKVLRYDGTVGLALEKEEHFLRWATLYDISVAGEETLVRRIPLYPTKVGDVTRSRENGQFMEFSVTLTEFATHFGGHYY